MGEIRDRLQAAIATIEEFADGRLDFRLRPPATEEQLLEAEHEFGHRLPEDLRALYLLHDGQDQRWQEGWTLQDFFPGHPFASIDLGMRGWRSMCDFWQLEPGQEPIVGFESDKGWWDPELRQVPADIAWFPFGRSDEDKTALYVDLNPVLGRPEGQVIYQGAWAHPPAYIGPSVLAVVERIAESISAGEMRIRQQEDFIWWGFGPAAQPLESVARDLFAN